MRLVAVKVCVTKRGSERWESGLKPSLWPYPLLRWEKLEGVGSSGVERVIDHLEVNQLFVHGGPAVGGHLSELDAGGIIAGDEATVTHGLPTELHPWGAEGGVALGDGSVGFGGIAEVGAPTFYGSAHELGDDVRMIAEKIAGGEHYAVRIVAGATGEKDAGFDAGLTGEEWLGGGEGLLYVVGIGDEIGDAHGRGNFVDVGKLETLGEILKPGRTRLDGDGVSVEVAERMDGRIFAHHDALRIVLHGCGDGDEWVTIGDGFQSAIGRAHAELGGTDRDLLIGDEVLAAGLNGEVEAFVFVVALDQRGIEAAMFGLGIPVGLEDYLGEASWPGCARAASCERDDGK
jgi:hypothetical protein